MPTDLSLYLPMDRRRVLTRELTVQGDEGKRLAV
jgi:hypothetical protein